jgi:hypothetical protein
MDAGVVDEDVDRAVGQRCRHERVGAFVRAQIAETATSACPPPYRRQLIHGPPVDHGREPRFLHSRIDIAYRIRYAFSPTFSRPSGSTAPLMWLSASTTGAGSSRRPSRRRTAARPSAASRAPITAWKGTWRLAWMRAPRLPWRRPPTPLASRARPHVSSPEQLPAARRRRSAARQAEPGTTRPGTHRWQVPVAVSAGAVDQRVMRTPASSSHQRALYPHAGNGPVVPPSDLLSPPGRGRADVSGPPGRPRRSGGRQE